MKQAPSQPCSAWATRLAARHPSDLSPDEKAALQAHLQNCPACTSISIAYALMETSIRQLPPVTSLEQLSPEQFEEASARPQHVSEPIMLPVRSRSAHSRHVRPRFSHTARVANLLAAALVVVVLIAGSVILFTHHPGTTQVGQQNFDLPPQAIPADFCAQAPLDPALKSLCEQHQLTKLDITKNVGGVPVTLAYAYADGNRVSIIAFAPSALLAVSPSAQPDSKQIMFGEITTADGKSLDGLGGTEGATGSGQYAFFTGESDTAALPGSTHTLNLQVPIVFTDMSHATATVTHRDSNSTSYAYAPGAIHTTTVTFDFSVPFHPARIAYPHQTITVDGQSVTLDRVDISPSEARVYLHGGPKVPGSPNTLKVGQTSIHDNGWQPSTRYTTDADFLYDVPLYDQQGEWTFTITPPGPNGGKLTYTFHFVVPAQA